MPRRIAFVTGASRGIGKASALTLAEAGFDVVATARTVREGESDAPGSLETTAAAVRERGRECLALPLDLLDRPSIDAAVDRTQSEWGPVDLLLNNGIYVGPETLQHFLDLSPDAVEMILRANVVAPVHLTQRLLPAMLERKAGTVVNVTSAVAEIDPPAPAGEGGWGLGYAASKGAFHRIAGFLHVELGARGIRAFNLEPGFVLTERMQLDLADAGFTERYAGAPPSVPAAAAAWLATSPDADRFLGKTVRAQKLVADLGLVPGWPPGS
jgi:NAD(P)-dependent dehydrogenase (short-subunit alcohol dehydrogenase family)